MVPRRLELPAIAQGLGALLLALACGACLCGPSAQSLLDARRDTPQHALEAFQTFFRAGLYTEEYRCFSRDFVRRNGLSLFTYSEFRDRQPWLKWFAKASVQAERASGEGVHDFEVSVAGRTLRVRMVREDFWQIRREDEVLADGYGRFEELLRPAPQDGTSSGVTLHLPAEDTALEVRTATSVAVERLWKIDDVLELEP
jgi:hypothetical protein